MSLHPGLGSRGPTPGRDRGTTPSRHCLIAGIEVFCFVVVVVVVDTRHGPDPEHRVPRITPVAFVVPIVCGVRLEQRPQTAEFSGYCSAKVCLLPWMHPS